MAKLPVLTPFQLYEAGLLLEIIRGGQSFPAAVARAGLDDKTVLRWLYQAQLKGPASELGEFRAFRKGLKKAGREAQRSILTPKKPGSEPADD